MSLAEQHQLSHETRPNRFPKIFQRALNLRPVAKKILSFGCSTGEECFSLAEVFPEAQIVGVDIDNWVVEQAAVKNKYPDRICFKTVLKQDDMFDVVFCLMVFFSLYDEYPFPFFNEALSELDKHINPGGLLVIYTAKYNFMTTSAAKHFIPIRQWMHKHNRDQKDYFDGYFEKKK
jgi:trans-aconitate methyltransferase